MDNSFDFGTTKEKIKILVVDDDQNNILLISKILNSKNYIVIEAHNGKECLERINSEKPDIILLDVVLPDICGFEISKKIKSDPKSHGIFIILISGIKTSKSDMAEGLDSLADDYITRPFTSKELLAHIESILRIRTLIKKLSESEEKYRLLAETAGDIIFVHDINGRILYSNQSGFNITGYSKDDISKLNVMDLVPPEFQKKLEAHIKERLSGDMSSRIFEVECIKKNGETVPLEIRSTPFWFNETMAFQVVARDISERKKAENKLKESNILYNTIAENLPSGIVHVFDKDFRYLYNAGEELAKVGLTNEMLIGKSIFDILPQNTAKFVERQYKKVLKGEKVSFEGDFNGKTFLVNAVPLMNSTGEIDKILVLSVNVTERKLMEKKYLEINNIFQYLTNAKDIQEIAKKTIECMRNILQLDTCFFALKNENKLEVIASHGISNPEKMEFDLDSKGIISYVGREGKPYLTNNCLEDPLFVHKYGKILPNSELAVPIKLQNQVIGVLNTESQNFGQYLSRDLMFLEFLANEVALAIGYLNSLNTIKNELFKSKKIKQELIESEERFRQFFEKSNDPILIIGEDDSIIDVNEAACKKFGYSKEEFLLLKLPDLQAPEVRGVPGSTIKTELEKYGGKPFEAVDVDKYGKRFYVEVVTTKIKLKGKDVIFNISRDITERKRLEDEIKLLYNAIEQAPSIVAITDKEGKLEYVNTKFVETTGYTISEVIGKNPRILKSGFLPEEYYEKLWDTIAAGNIWRGEFQNRKKDGTLYWESASIAPVKDSAGEIKHYVKVSEDITYKKLAEQELKEKEETLRGILSAAPIGINLIQNRMIKWTNHAMTEITGYSEHELINMNLKFLYENEDEFERVGLIYSNAKESLVTTETKWLTKDKRLLDILILSRPLNPYDLSKGHITIVSDITLIKTSQSQLDENLEYFAHLVDQIRNPLAIMSGFIQVEIEKEELKNRLIRQIDRIEDLIKQLDQGWLDTEETRKFLKRYM